MKKETTIEVMFREEADGTVLAVFPHECWDLRGNCGCFTLKEGHSACDYNGYVLKETKPTKNYKELFRYLDGIGYDLKVIQRRDYDKFLLSYAKRHNTEGIN